MQNKWFDLSKFYKDFQSFFFKQDLWAVGKMGFGMLGFRGNLLLIWTSRFTIKSDLIQKKSLNRRTIFLVTALLNNHVFCFHTTRLARKKIPRALYGARSVPRYKWNSAVEIFVYMYILFVPGYIICFYRGTNLYRGRYSSVAFFCDETCLYGLIYTTQVNKTV
jgi:hypothetical protein